MSISFRTTVQPDDREHIRRIVTETGFFYPEEIEVAVELVDERIAKGLASGYYFLFAELNNQVVGYTCFGPIPCTKSSFDMYWIAVQPSSQRHGIGRQLLYESESQMRELGAKRIYVDTSSRPQYATTRAFYEHFGYQTEAVLKDFYDVGDDRVIFGKMI